ncbi:hypothetical protein, partial [Paraburkholderia graminis]
MRVDARRPLTIETNQAVAACAATAKSKTFAACFTATAKTFVATSTACVIAAQAITGAAKTANCKLQLEKKRSATSPATAPFASTSYCFTALPCR